MPNRLRSPVRVASSNVLLSYRVPTQDMCALPQVRSTTRFTPAARRPCPTMSYLAHTRTSQVLFATRFTENVLFCSKSRTKQDIFQIIAKAEGRPKVLQGNKWSPLYASLSSLTPRPARSIPGPAPRPAPSPIPSPAPACPAERKRGGEEKRGHCCLRNDS